jgi:IS605 OrfB family transposase
MRSYNTRLSFESQEEFQKVLDFLKAQRDCVNAGYAKAFTLEKLSIVEFHHKFYHEYMKGHAVPSQLVIRAEKEVLASYRSMKSNKHEKSVPEKVNLSCRLDKRIYTLKGSTIRLTTLENRINAQIQLYPHLSEILESQTPCDPLIFERNGEIWISLAFTDPEVKFTPRLAVGIDLGVRRLAATSEGKLFIDKKFNGRIRKIRHNKRALQSKGTKGSRRKLRKIARREARMKRSMLHSLANKLLQTPANVLVLEDLTKIKFKVKRRPGSKQTSFAGLRQILTYKAPLVGKRVVTVSPYYTSQIDCLSGNREGERKGTRFYQTVKNGGAVLDADLNAACNIAFRYSGSKIGAKLPVSWLTPLDGQARVNSPIAFKSTRESGLVLQAGLL